MKKFAKNNVELTAQSLGLWILQHEQRVKIMIKCTHLQNITENYIQMMHQFRMQGATQKNATTAIGGVLVSSLCYDTCT